MLKFRGNPLPEGGFVTSYADITSYKNAARELRSLADALEQRVAMHPRPGRRPPEAEAPTAPKPASLAAAVHDLLQPLNAARMFTSLLRSHLPDEAGRQAADSIEALAAQDAILNSLLDISRMESASSSACPRRAAGPAAAGAGPQLWRTGRKPGACNCAACPPAPWCAPTKTCCAASCRTLSPTPSATAGAGASWWVAAAWAGTCASRCTTRAPASPRHCNAKSLKEFRRLDEGRADDRGAGLGLAIVERLGRLLGHEIGLRSQLGRGSVFLVNACRWATRPQRNPSAPTTAQPASDDAHCKAAAPG